MKKKLFLAYRSGTGPYALNAMIARAFESIGWTVIPLNCILLDIGQFKHIYNLHENSVDFYLEIGRGCIPIDIIKKAKIPTIMWMPTIITKANYAIKITKECLPFFNRVYTSIPSEIPLYKECGVKAYPLFTAACPLFFEKRNINQDIQVGLLGNMKYLSRINLQKAIKHKYDIYSTFAHHQYVELINRIKINLNVGLFTFGIPRRVFEIMACGGFLLSYQLTGIDNIFEDGKHLVYFNEQNILEKIEYYLKNEEERKRIAKQGQEEVLKNHLFKHRVQQIIRDIL